MSKTKAKAGDDTIVADVARLERELASLKKRVDQQYGGSANGGMNRNQARIADHNAQQGQKAPAKRSTSAKGTSKVEQAISGKSARSGGTKASGTAPKSKGPQKAASRRTSSSRSGEQLAAGASAKKPARRSRS